MATFNFTKKVINHYFVACICPTGWQRLSNARRQFVSPTTFKPVKPFNLNPSLWSFLTKMIIFLNYHRIRNTCRGELRNLAKWHVKVGKIPGFPSLNGFGFPALMRYSCTMVNGLYSRSSRPKPQSPSFCNAWTISDSSACVNTDGLPTFPVEILFKWQWFDWVDAEKQLFSHFFIHITYCRLHCSNVITILAWVWFSNVSSWHYNLQQKNKIHMFNLLSTSQ